jgi:hypothetical protein
MDRIVIDAELAAKLYKFHGKPVQLVDATGRVVANVEPQVDPAEYALVGDLEDEFTPEEIEQMLAPDQKCFTTREVLMRLWSLK